MTSSVLQGRIALVTGGTRGLGFAIARALLDCGATVVLTGRSDEGCAAAAGRLASPEVSFLTGDAMVGSDVRSWVAGTEALHGRLDILVNNVGGVVGNAMGAFTDVSPNSWEEMFSLNVHSAFHATQAALPGMVARGFGRVINMSSVEGKQGSPGLAAYTATKHALNGLSKAVAHEVGTAGVTVNALCPGLCATEGVLASADHAASIGMTMDELLSAFTSKTAIKRLVQPAEVAALAVFLASDAASAMTGLTLSVDGGQSPF